MRELRHLYGAGILFFYYAKWPILLGLPAIYYGLEYPHNVVLDILWIWSLALVFKDLYVWFVLKGSYCEDKRCDTDTKKERKNDAGDHTENESP